MFEYTDQTLGLIQSPASERSAGMLIQIVCRTEEIVDGDEPADINGRTRPEWP